jgi:hypothetical protein
VLFNKDETSGQFHIGFRSIFDHYFPENSDITKNYTLYCKWYGAIDAVAATCPEEKPTADAHELTDTFDPPPARPTDSNQRTSQADQLAALNKAAMTFLNAWYIGRAASSDLKQYIAKDNAYAFAAIKWEMHAEVVDRKMPSASWERIFGGAYAPTKPTRQKSETAKQAPATLDDAIEFVPPITRENEWTRKAVTQPKDRDRTKSYYALFDPQDAPPGVFFPKPYVPQPGTPFMPAHFDPRAQYLNHLLKAYPNRLKVMVYSVIGNGLLQEGAVLYWINDGKEWKLAAYQGTD